MGIFHAWQNQKYRNNVKEIILKCTELNLTYEEIGYIGETLQRFTNAHKINAAKDVAKITPETFLKDFDD